LLKKRDRFLHGVRSGDEAAELVDPSEGPPGHPAMLSQVPAGTNASPGSAGNDVPGPQVSPATGVVITLAGVQVIWPFAWPSTLLLHRLKRIYGFGLLAGDR